MAIVAAAAIGAAGAVAGGVIASQGAQAAAKAGKGSAHTIPLPKYQRGLESHYARLLAENELNVPPSFGQYVQSGGTATFPITDPGFTPREARELGFVGKQGQKVPFVQPGATSLTPEQALYLGYQRSQSPGADPRDALLRAYRLNQRMGKLEGRTDTPGREQKISRLRARRDKLLGGMPVTLE